MGLADLQGMKFLSTPSARRATSGLLPMRSGHPNFYPRPPRGGRRVPWALRHGWSAFLSTPSARRATASSSSSSMTMTNFYPRPPRGGRHARLSNFALSGDISIHALREEGDSFCWSTRRTTMNFYPRPPRGGRPQKTIYPYYPEKFLSTPSARRATAHGWWSGSPHGISIHALREEGDSKNGEKHLRFCFIIKRSAQIWKSFSKNIRKKSRDLHRMP